MKIIELQAHKTDEERATITQDALRQVADGRNLEEAKARLRHTEKENQRRYELLPEGFPQFRGPRPKDGMFKFYGYRVGNHGSEERDRRAALDEMMETKALLPVHSKGYMDEWGRPMSIKRYKKIAACLEAFIKACRRGSEKALKEWRADLEYLEQTWAPRLLRRRSFGE